MNILIDKTSSLGEWLSEELGVVSSVISNHLQSNHGAVNDVCGELAAYRGKMLRPSLLLLSWKTVFEDAPTPQHISTAAAVLELIHLATLVHDDVLDEADLRRGKRTINTLCGNETAVMLGDYLLSSAFHLCSTIGNPNLNLLLGEVTNTLCAGEVVQLFNRNNVDLDVDSYYQIIHDKTASLISASCEMGAILGNGDEDCIQALKVFGNHVGTAFQIKDDLLDLLGCKKIIGKPAGRDLEKGKLTLPVILMLSKNPELKTRVLVAINDNNHRELICMLNSAGTISVAFEEIKRLVSSATNSIERVFSNDGASKLCEIAEQLNRPI